MARKQLLRFVILILSFLCLKEVNARKLTGYFVSNAGDTVRVIFIVPYDLIRMPDLNFVQYKVKYQGTNGKKSILRPTQAKEIYFIAESDTIHMISKKVPDFLWLYFDDSLFLRVKILGTISLYSFYLDVVHHKDWVSSPIYQSREGALMVRTGHERTGIILEKNRQFFVPRLLHFKKDMQEFLSDCPTLAEKIAPEHSPSLPYSPEGIEKIVSEYNQECIQD